MKELVVISGKGGTGKTSITAAFASLAPNAVLADCDVDAADLHLVMEPKIRQESDFSGGKKASIIAEKCIGCGKCADMCRFEAIHLNGSANDIVGKTYKVDPVSCEGCKVCVEFCPVGAISFEPAINGKRFISDTRFGPMVHAKLGIAEEDINPKMTGKIEKDAKEKGLKVIGKIPYDESFTKAQIMKATLIEYTGGDIAEKVKSMFREITYALG